MRLLFLFIFITLNTFIGSGQDTLYYHNGNKEVVNVKDRRSDYVEYRSLDTNDRSLYKKSYTAVDKIVFKENSTFGKSFDLRNPAPIVEEDREVKRPYEIAYFNRIGIDVFDLLYSNLTVYYQRTFPKAKNLTIGIPVSISPGAVFNKNYLNENAYYISTVRRGYYSDHKIFSSGIELMSYPDRLVFGAAIDFGLVRNQYIVDHYDGTQESKILDSPFFGLFVRLGYDLNFTNRFGASFYGNLGFGRIVSYYVYYDSYLNESRVERYNDFSFNARINLRIHYSF